MSTKVKIMSKRAFDIANEISVLRLHLRRKESRFVLKNDKRRTATEEGKLAQVKKLGNVIERR